MAQVAVQPSLITQISNVTTNASIRSLNEIEDEGDIEIEAVASSIKPAASVRPIFRRRRRPPVVKPSNTKKLIDILNPKRPLLPVELPPIGRARREKLPDAPPAVTSSNSIIPTIDDAGATDADKKNKMNIQVPFVEGDDDPNPFEYPENMEHFLEKSEAERAEKRRKDMEVLENPLMKGTNLFKQNQTVLARIKPFLQPPIKPSLARDYKQIVWKAQHGLHINHLQKVSRKMHTEYITQRKDIYYLRRAIRARKIALDMVQKTREFEEACLKDYEWLTDFTKEAFETFLRENDDETHLASRKAEIALKEKLDKTLEVRQLNIQINQIKTDIIATNESLRECKTYMRFLDDIAREIMRKDEEEEIRAQHREQQVKEELIGYLKQGMSLRKAQQLIEERIKEVYDESFFVGGGRRGSFGAGSVDFINSLNRQVRKHLGMPEEITEEVVETRRKSIDEGEKERKRSEDEGERYGRVSLEAEDEKPAKKSTDETKTTTLNQAGMMSPSSIVTKLVFRNQGRLNKVVAKHEEKTFDLAPLIALRQSLTDESARRKTMGSGGSDRSSGSSSKGKRYTGIEDDDGYNEIALLSSLDLVPGNEDTDRRELASLSFTRPSQLLQIYSDMEEANLSLIQHSQASEELLERVNQQILHTRRALNHRGRLLREDINHMQANIDANEERATALAMLVEMFTGGNYDVRQQQKLFRVLQHHVAKVYKTAVGSIDHHLNPIMMLTSIEKNFEDLMREIQAMPTDVVVQISRELDKERREMERLEKMNRRKAVEEERKSRQLVRAQAPAHRRKGRPLLARSHPPKVVIQLSQAELDKKAEEDEFNYFFGV